jgi:hypothetical protein
MKLPRWSWRPLPEGPPELSQMCASHLPVRLYWEPPT